MVRHTRNHNSCQTRHSAIIISHRHKCNTKYAWCPEWRFLKKIGKPKNIDSGPTTRIDSNKNTLRNRHSMVSPDFLMRFRLRRIKCLGGYTTSTSTPARPSYL
jgi:hypothetical protein